MAEHVGIIGLGNMGTTIGNVIARNGHFVTGWEYNADVVEEINANHTNTLYLRGVTLHNNLVATSYIADVFTGKSIVFVALPSMFIANVLGSYKGVVSPSVIIVNLAKGIDKNTGRTAFEMIADFFPANNKVMVSGPSIANEISKGMPTAVVAAGPDDISLRTVKKVLGNRDLFVSLSHDARGIELGGILKNIYAIGLGVFDGKKITSINFRSIYLTMALHEMAQTGLHLGAKPETFSFISGVGDLFATSLSEHSHNRRLGELMTACVSLNQVRLQMGILPEGYNTLEAFLNIAKRKGFRMPLAQALWDVIHCRIDTDTFVHTIIKGLIP
jgi:glycerol-3-phosphate dehydrogenase (NAD(P)+)